MLTPDVAVDLVVEALRLVMLLAVVLVVPGLITGLLVALAQINEQTMSFLPRLLVTLLAMILMGRWMTGYLMDFCVSIFQRAATLVG